MGEVGDLATSSPYHGLFHDEHVLCRVLSLLWELSIEAGGEMGAYPPSFIDSILFIVMSHF